MTSKYTFKDWLKASNNHPNWSERYLLCMRAINTFFEDNDSLKGIFSLAKKEGYFSHPERLRQNNNPDNQKLLEHLRKVNNRLDEVKFDDSSYDTATFFAYEDTNSNRQTLSKTDWIQIRQTALDQLARYLLGRPPDQAVQADHIRSVYQSRITKALESGVFSKDFPILSDQLVVIEANTKAIASAFKDNKFTQKLSIKNVEEDGDRIKITFNLGRKTHSPNGVSS